MAPTRKQFVDFALTFAGCSATGARSDDYLALLTRNFEPPQIRKDMAKMSCCALFVRALWWCFGVEHRIYSSPYKISRAGADVITIAKDNGAYRNGSLLDETYYPKAGDAFYIVDPNGKREHFGLFTSEPTVKPDTWIYETVEGGQGAGGRTISALKRTIYKHNSSKYGSTGDRLLIAWFDLASFDITGLRPEMKSTFACSNTRKS
jgi:hypothetical protein